MLRYAVIGTSAIARQFVDAAAAQGSWQLCGVLGSSPQRGRDFCAAIAATPDVVAHEDFDALLRSRPDVVYLASPNHLHAEAAGPLLERGVHVVVEKPAFATVREWEEAHAAADRSGVLLLEAARHVYEANYRTLRRAVADLGPVTGASLVFRQYSSRWPAYLAGQRPRVFSAAHSGGALVDLGVYQLYAVLDWFGIPDEAQYRARLLPTGADAEGVALLRYPDFDVSLVVSKVHRTGQRSEIYGEGGRLLAVNNVAGIAWLRHESPDGERDVPLAPLDPNPLAAEADHLARRLLAHPHEPADAPYTAARLGEWGRQVITLSDRLRRSAGIVFPGDASA